MCLAHLFSPPNTLHEKKILSYVKDTLLANWNFFFLCKKNSASKNAIMHSFHMQMRIQPLQKSFPGRPQKWVQGLLASASVQVHWEQQNHQLGPSEPNWSMSSFQSRLNFRFFTTLHTKRWVNESYLMWNKYFRIEMSSFIIAKMFFFYKNWTKHNIKNVNIHIKTKKKWMLV